MNTPFTKFSQKGDIYFIFIGIFIKGYIKIERHFIC